MLHEAASGKSGMEDLMREVADLFSELEDPRCGNAKRHDFSELLFIALYTVMSGGETCVDMALFARTREVFLKHFIRMENGPPSHDTWTPPGKHLDTSENTSIERIIGDLG